MQSYSTPARGAAHRIDPADDVAVAIRELEPGEAVSLGASNESGSNSIHVRELIPRGHKLAVRRISAGNVRVSIGLVI